MAKAASFRSLDLSRQVGAAIFTPAGEVVSLGCNEVPKGGGGTYWPEDRFDDRDYKRQEDPNVRVTTNNVMDFVDRLSKKYFQKLKAVQLEKVLQSKEVQQSKVMDSLEFGRVIHAEMSAISDAARP